MLKYTQLIKRALVYSTYTLWSFIVLSFFTPALPWGAFGALMGEIAIGMLVLVTLPGILKRFGTTGSLQQVQLLLMAARRQTGNLMFTFAVAHALWVRILIYIRFGMPDPARIPLFQIFGTLALFLLLPLFLTSNNFSLRLLKKNWQKVHSLLYIVVWLAALHTFLGEEGILWGIVAVCIGIGQIASWIFVLRKKQLNA